MMTPGGASNASSSPPPSSSPGIMMTPGAASSASSSPPPSSPMSSYNLTGLKLEFGSDVIQEEYYHNIENTEPVCMIVKIPSGQQEPAQYNSNGLKMEIVGNSFELGNINET